MIYASEYHNNYQVKKRSGARCEDLRVSLQKESTPAVEYDHQGCTVYYRSEDCTENDADLSVEE